MQKAKLMLTCLTFLGIATLAGCSFPGVYKIDIQQGNVITQDMIDQLRPGMTRSQVRFIMGNPLITDTFHANRWDYLYSIQPGGGPRQQERVSLTFDRNDRLMGLSGNFLPGTSRDDAIHGKPSPAAVAPAAPQKAAAPVTTPPAPVAAPKAAAPGSLLERLQRQVDDAQPAPVPKPGKIE
ncbi:MAG: outer membrane protein assembly factor BamE [Pseudomonas sp.]